MIRSDRFVSGLDPVLVQDAIDLAVVDSGVPVPEDGDLSGVWPSMDGLAGLVVSLDQALVAGCFEPCRPAINQAVVALVAAAAETGARSALGLAGLAAAKDADRLAAVSHSGFADDVVPAAAVAAAAGLPAGSLLVPLLSYDLVGNEVSRAIDRVSSSTSLVGVMSAGFAATHLLDSLRSLGLLSAESFWAGRSAVREAAAAAAVVAAEEVCHV